MNSLVVALPSFGSPADNRHVVTSGFVLELYNYGTSLYETVPADQYRIDRRNGMVVQRQVDDAGDGVDWTAYHDPSDTVNPESASGQWSGTISAEGALTVVSAEALTFLLDGVPEGQPGEVYGGLAQYLLVEENEIGNQSVRNTKIVDGTIGTDQIADAALTSTKIDINAILSEHIAAGAVTYDKMAVNSLAALTVYTGALHISDWLTIDPAGGIFQGTYQDGHADDPDYPSTGLKLWSTGNIGRISGYLNGILQAEFSADGRFSAAYDSLNPLIVIDATGFRVNGNFAGTGGSIGPNNGGTFGSNAGVGTADWTNPSYAQFNDSSWATADITAASAASANNASATFSDLSSVGTVAWSNPANAGADDASDATANLSGATSDSATNSGGSYSPGGGALWVGQNCAFPDNGGDGGRLGTQNSGWLLFKGLGFTLPSAAAPTGVRAVVTHSYSSAHLSPAPYDTGLEIIKGGAPTGTNKSGGASISPTGNTLTGGGSGDLWSVALTAANCNENNFGIAYSCATDCAYAQTVTASIAVTIWYTVANTISHYLKLIGAGFALPSNAAVNGLVASIKGKADTASRLKDSHFYWLKAGVVGGTDLASASYWSTTEATTTRGTSSNTAGRSWLYSDINAATFGCVLSVRTTGGAVVASVNLVTITVYYQTSANSTTYYLTVTNFGFSVPVGATVVGWLPEASAHADVEGVVTDYSVKMIQGGSIAGAERAAGTAIGLSDAYIAYGAADDLHGLTWSVAQANASTTGLAVSYTTAYAPVTVSANHVRLTCYYTTSAGNPPLDFGGVRLPNIGAATVATDAVRYDQLGPFGDGSDGDVTIDADTTLARDMAYRNLTVNAGQTLSTAGYAVRVAGTLVNNGVIDCSGSAGGAGADGTSADTGGTSGAAPYPTPRSGHSVPGAGGTGGATASAGTANGSAVSGLNSFVGAGAAAAAAFDLQSGSGGAGGAAHGTSPGNGTAGSKGFAGAAGGDGGAGTGTGSHQLSGGGGGGGGGILEIWSRTINNAGTIRANGGRGGNGVTATDKSGNGGGGGGGCVFVGYRSTTGSGVGTLTANGGNAGTGGNGGTAGDNGKTISQQV